MSPPVKGSSSGSSTTVTPATENSPGGSSDGVHKCTFCSKTFPVLARLTRHQRIHTGERPFVCDLCGKSFSVKENLSVHRRVHTNERPYRCPHCDRGFEHSGKLHRHMRIHTGERPHQCRYCGKTFIQSGQLVIHTRSHTGEKPYVCTVCTKAFTCSKQLKVHSRTHTGERPYTCSICGKKFAYNHVLKLHQMAHMGQKLYKCTLCSSTFRTKKALSAHLRSHALANQASSRPSSSNSPQASTSGANQAHPTVRSTPSVVSSSRTTSEEPANCHKRSACRTNSSIREPVTPRRIQIHVPCYGPRHPQFPTSFLSVRPGFQPSYSATNLSGMRSFPHFGGVQTVNSSTGSHSSGSLRHRELWEPYTGSMSLVHTPCTSLGESSISALMNMVSSTSSSDVPPQQQSSDVVATNRGVPPRKNSRFRLQSEEGDSLVSSEDVQTNPRDSVNDDSHVDLRAALLPHPRTTSVIKFASRPGNLASSSSD